MMFDTARLTRLYLNGVTNYYCYRWAGEVTRYELRISILYVRQFETKS